MKTFFFFFFWRALALCVLGPWPWPRAFLSLASRVSVLGKAVLGLGLGLGFFLCPWPWPWPRALCPRLHLCLLYWSSGNAFVSGSGGQKFKSRAGPGHSTANGYSHRCDISSKVAGLSGRNEEGWAPPTRYTLHGITASIIKDLMCILNRGGVLEDTF